MNYIGNIAQRDALKLGISTIHDTSVALTDDEGKILFAASEERFTRVKQQGGFPKMALDHVRSMIDVSKADILVPDSTVYLKAYRILRTKVLSYLNRKTNPTLTRSSLGARYQKRTSFYKDYDNYFPGSKRRKYVEHHLAHAASAYYLSGFQNANILTLDGHGDLLTGNICIGNGSEMARTKRFHINEAMVGQKYEVVTAMLGFKAAKHEGKITGLAAFGKDNKECIETLENFFNSVAKKKTPKALTYFYYLSFHPEGNAELKNIRSTVFKNFSDGDIAYAVQYLAEKETLELIDKYCDRNIKNITLAGGVFSNVKLNQRIMEHGFNNIFVQPAMPDMGLSMGAIFYDLGKKGLKPFPIRDVYLGPSYSDEEIKTELEKANVTYQKFDEGEIEGQIAELIHKGKVIGRFAGRMEFGPRALGNRTIMYHTTEPEINTWLNKNLKRTEFMPFAPATLYEAAEKCYINTEKAKHSAEFMTITFDCTDWMKQSSPAVVHVDGTARPQLVRKEINKSFYNIIKEYYKISGIPSVINTSFNMHEEPIICSPYDAIRGFQASKIDYLAIENFLVKRQ